MPRGALDQPQREYDPAARGLYHQNRWAAARFGLAAELFHPDGERDGEGPRARRGARGEKLDTSSTESERQLEVGRSSGLDAVCADLVERTLG